MNILLATGSDVANNAIRKLGYDVIGEIYERSELRDACFKLKPDVVILSENLKGTDKVLIEEMLYIKSNIRNIRIIYLAGNVDLRNKDKVNRLASLVFAGIYDIYGEKKLTLTALKELIDSPKKYEDVSYLTRYLKKEVLTQDSFVEMENTEEAIDDVEANGYKNVVLVSSVKPGSGKTYLSSNLAAGLAKFGKKDDGTNLKILIIDADLQNLSVGTVLDIEDNKFNLKTINERISRIINKDGDLVADNKEILETNEFLNKCCLQSKSIKNLYAITGSQLSMDEVESISPYIYIYMIEVFSKIFDYVIVDSNSSLFHTTTYPMLKLSGKIYYVLDLDYNNVRNNQRYKKDFKDMDISGKIKYVLNEDVDLTQGIHNENLLFDSSYIENKLKFDLIAKLPNVDKPVFLNRIFKGIPIILDDNHYTLNSRYELLKVVNDIHEVSELEITKNKLLKHLKSTKGKGIGKSKFK